MKPSVSADSSEMVNDGRGSVAMFVSDTTKSPACIELDAERRASVWQAHNNAANATHTNKVRRDMIGSMYKLEGTW